MNTMRGFRKEKNMQANPHVTLLIFETDSPLRYLEVRGHVVEMTEDGAVAHLDELARSYTGRSPYFGKVVAEELRDQETPVLCRIAPQHAVTT